MSQKSTPRKGLFDNMIKGLEQDKLKYNTTPTRKSLSFSLEDKENLKYTPSSSISYTQEKDKTFQIDHLKESYNYTQSVTKPKENFRRSSDVFRELGDNSNLNNNMQTNYTKVDHFSTLPMRNEKPPINKPGTFLHGNTCKLKLRDKLKKLKVMKTELSHIVKDIEVEKMKISELKHSIFNDIRKDFEDQVKNDEIRLKEDMNKCLAIMNELQEWELSAEMKIEKSNSISEEDILALDETLKRFDNIGNFKQKSKNIDLKLIEKDKLDQIERELKAARDEVYEAKENCNKYKLLHETAVQLNQVLSKKTDEQNEQIDKMEVILSDRKEEEDERRRQEGEIAEKFAKLEKEREELKANFKKDQEALENKFKREIEKQKTNFFDEMLQINSLIKRISANITHDYHTKMNEQEEVQDNNQLFQALRQNVNELGKIVDKELDKERTKIQESHREREKSLKEEYDKYKENIQEKVEREKEEIRENLTQNFKKKTDELLKEIWSLKSQLATMTPSEDYRKLEETLKEKNTKLKELEEEKDCWPKKTGEEVNKKIMEMRRDNITSIGLLKEKHEQELKLKEKDVKEYYENILEQESQEMVQLRDENDFLNKELESANKQIFELMRYKADFNELLEEEGQKLQEKLAENQEMMYMESDTKIRALQETNLKTIRTYEEKINKLRVESEMEKAETRDTIQGLQREYELKIEELREKYQQKLNEYRDKMQAFNRFREGQEKNMTEITNNLVNVKSQLGEKDREIMEKEKAIQALSSRVEILEHESQRTMHYKDLSYDKSHDRSQKSFESSRTKQKKIMQQIMQRVGHLGEVLGGQTKTVPGTLRQNALNQDLKPLYQIGKELEVLTKELNNDISQMSLHDHEHDYLLEEKSIDAIDAHKANQSKLSQKALNISNQSMVSTYPRDSSYIQEDLREKSIDLQANKESKGIQSDFVDDSIFPPFDHRVCLRCKKNDLTSPNYCKYSNLQKLEDLSFQSSKSSSYKVSKSHIYGVNVRFKSKIETNPYENLFKKESPSEYSEKGVNTIISNNDFAGQNASDLKEEDLLELKTPRTETNRDNI